MEAAAVLAFGLQDFLDAGIICAILMLNAIVGWSVPPECCFYCAPRLTIS